jgi:hypothetical protein
MNFVSYRDASQPQADLGEGRMTSQRGKREDFLTKIVHSESRQRRT